MNSRLSLFFRGSVFRILQTVAGTIVGFLLMPFLIARLGAETYGLWVVVSSVVATYYLLDVGFNQGVTRYVTAHIHQEDFDSANRVINTALAIYTGLGACVLLVSVLFAFAGVDRLVENPDKVALVQILLLIAGLQLAIEFPSKAFPGVISAYMRFDWIASVRTVRVIVDGVLIYLFVSSGYGLVAIAVIGFVTGLTSTYIYVRIVNHLFQEARYSRDLIDKNKFGELFHFSKWVFVLDTSNMLRDKVGPWFIAYFLGNAILTTFYVAVRLTDFAVTFLNQAVGMTMPLFTELYAKKRWEELRQMLNRFLKLDLMLGVLTVCGFYVVGEVFIALWMGSDFPYHDAWRALVVLAIGRMAVFITSPLQCILFAFNRHRVSALISLAEIVTTCVLCVAWIPGHGILGAAYAVTVPNLVARLLMLVLATNAVFRFLSLILVVRAATFALVASVLTYYMFGADLAKEPEFSLLLVRGLAVVTAVGATSLMLLDKSDFVYVAGIVRRIWRGRGNQQPG